MFDSAEIDTHFKVHVPGEEIDIIYLTHIYSLLLRFHQYQFVHIALELAERFVVSVIEHEQVVTICRVKPRMQHLGHSDAFVLLKEHRQKCGHEVGRVFVVIPRH